MTHSQTAPGRLGVGMIGHSFMGAAHSQAWRSVGHAYELPLQPAMTVVAGRDADRAASAAEQLGWASSTDDWHEVVARDDVDLIDICTPGNTHAEIAITALDAGKHVLCEKPLANTVDEAEAMVAAAERAARAGVQAMVGFNYRRVPAIAVARRFVAEGRLGTLHHVRAQYLQDFIADPSLPMIWRLQADLAGSGALGDIGAHIIDLSQYLTGDRLTGVSGTTETFVTQRPVHEGGTEMGEVTVDDAAVFFGRMSRGALASYEATRFATGRKNALRVELNGSHGSLAFDFEAMNELWFHDHTIGAAEAGFRRILATEADHPYMEGWWPPGHGLGYEHTFTHEVRDLLHAIAEGTEPSPSFAEGLRVQRVLEAVQRSAANAAVWTPIKA